MSTLRSQIYWLLKRNCLLKIRYKQLTFQEIFIPLVFVANLATIRFTTQVDPLKPITSSQLTSHDLIQPQFMSSFEYAIAFTPDNADTENITSELASQLNIMADPPVVGFASEEELLDAYVNATTNISLALVFTEEFPGNLSYKIRLSYGSLPFNYGPFEEMRGKLKPYIVSCYGNDPAYGIPYPANCEITKYLYSGFAAIQALTEHFILRLVTGNFSLPIPDIAVEMMPKGQYNYPIDSLRITASAYIVLAYMPFTAVLMTVLVAEKEYKIKECMNIMGMRNTAFWLAWFIVYSVIILAVALIVAGYTKAITLFSSGNFFLIFLALFLYGLSVVTMAFMLTPFFQRATSAGAMGSIALMLFIAPYIALGLLGFDAIPTPAIWVLCLLSPVAISSFFDRAILYEQNLGGIQFSNMTLGPFPAYAPIVMLIVDIILYLSLAIYLENVVPGGYGVTRSPFFCLSPSFWCGKKSKGETDTTGLLNDANGSTSNLPEGNDDVEPVPSALRDRNGIRIRNIRKTFPPKKGQPEVKAVDGISLDIYEGQITCLLGHNGAGKSTLISCLTGLYTPTDGGASIYNLNITNPDDLDQIRGMTGVCLQENTIFEFLSPEEHLTFYAGLKGIPKEKIPEAVDEVVKLIDLDTQRATFSKHLSGGQKRKLCVGMAIIGNPKVLFLDEPSSGMDPYSRRKMWALLKKQREGRVTLLTTHFMDEADILADRKAIVSQGKLRCCGSSLFLKNKFGLGYHLSMVVESDCDRDKITSVVKSHVPEALVSRSHGMELSFRLPLKDVSNFAGMFEHLEKSDGAGGATASQAMGIQTYGVSMTTLEEVFLKIGEEAEVEEADAVSAPAPNGMSIEESGEGAAHSVTVNLNQSPLDSTVLATHPIEASHSEQMKALALAELIRVIRNPVTYIFRLFMPVAIMVVGGVLSKTITFGGNSPTATPDALWFRPEMYFPPATGPYSPPASELLYQDSLPTGQDIADVVTQFDRLDIGSNATGNLSMLYDLRPHSGAVDMMDLGIAEVAAMFTTFYNDTALHSLPVLISTMSNVLLGIYNSTSDPNTPVITAASHPFPKPAELPEYGFSSGILFVFLFGFGLNFVPVGFPVDRVKEREKKIKAQLRIQGIDTLSYWGSVFVIDAGQLLFVGIIGIIVMVAIQVPSLTTGGAIFCFLIGMVFYVPIATIQAYCVGFVFDKFETAQAYGYFFFMHIPLILFLPTMFIDIYVSTAGAGGFAIASSLLYPITSLFNLLYFIDKVYQKASLFGQQDDIVFGDYFLPENFVWPILLIMLVDIVLVCFFLRFLEIVKTGGDARDTCPCLVDKKIGLVEKNPDIIDEEDEDIVTERKRVDNIFDENKTCAVAIQELRREFVKRTKEKESTKVAVRNLSLAVETGEVLGLLGPNGAGKTTTMNMVTADFAPTNGQVRVGGNDITSAVSSAYQAMGYCPQIDPLWDDLTLREHLETYAAFKGIHKADRSLIADHYMDCLKVTEHADKKAKELSGGTKRKLCFALSMLGEPQIVLLDEPSTGMDPGSKRFLWNTITSSFINRKGAILTTHSMEEADAVCSRVGIMISGQLKCLGTTQHLKDKYGGGYIMEIKLNPGAYYYLADQTNTSVMDILDQKMEALHERVLEFLPKAEVIESFAERITYRIQRDGVVTLSTIFHFLEKGKEEFGIEEYSFSQTTLEQVFIEFAKAQVDDQEEESNTPEVNDPHRPSSRHSRRSAPKPQISVES
ncbi:cholesterol transporter ABCA5-like [Diadema setosum]|uniref:cholesterol transporter ABCA5-like n=1 Tax=Diadema setosum TaxID=31175 RepID=UPI003B3A47D7